MLLIQHVRQEKHRSSFRCDAELPSQLLLLHKQLQNQSLVHTPCYILQTTIGIASFELGPESCSEPIDVAVIYPDQRFEWVEQKEF